MAEFSRSDFYVDTLLTSFVIGYKNPLYIADLIAPIVPVDRPTGFIPQYPQSDWFRNQAHKRATATKSRRAGFRVDSTATYAVQRSSFGVEIPDEVRDAQMDPYSLDRDCAEFATDKVMMEREISFVSTAFGTGIWGTDYTGGVNFTPWNNYGASTPLLDLTAYEDSIEGGIGQTPNTLVMGKAAWSMLKFHPDAIDLIKYTQRGIMTPELFASMLDIQRVLIGRGIYTVTPEGTAEASVVYQRIWGKHVLLLYVPERPSMMTPAGAYTLTWRRVPNSLQYLRRMRDEEREVDVLESNSYYQHRITVPRAGVFLSGAVA